ncbi:MAG TPA: response regulator, partial [Bryobacteraceae bacterium]|nr:response regulator [Bryobacteraceae bacterium]
MKGRILIVEDESIVQLDLQRRLERLGYTVVAVTARGEEAISQAALLRPDLVLMDVHLTGQMNGIE